MQNALKSQKKAVSLKEQIDEINDIIEQTYYFEQKLFEWGRRVENNKKRISKHMGKRKRKSIRVDDDLAFSVKKNIETSIEFYPSQIRKNFNKKMYKRMTNKTVIVNDLEGLIKMLKKKGISPKEFKKYIETEESVDEKSVDELLDSGEIEVNDLQGCYKVNANEEIIVRKEK